MVVKTTDQVALNRQFHTLAQQWQEDCGLISSTSAMVAHPVYQAIIQLGWPVVPLLLQELNKGPVHWFEALRAITGEDPVALDDWGNIPAMAAAWLEWGRSPCPSRFSIP